MPLRHLITLIINAHLFSRQRRKKDDLYLHYRSTPLLRLLALTGCGDRGQTTWAQTIISGLPSTSKTTRVPFTPRRKQASKQTDHWLIKTSFTRSSEQPCGQADYQLNAGSFKTHSSSPKGGSALQRSPKNLLFNDVKNKQQSSDRCKTVSSSKTSLISHTSKCQK